MYGYLSTHNPFNSRYKQSWFYVYYPPVVPHCTHTNNSTACHELTVPEHGNITFSKGIAVTSVANITCQPPYILLSGSELRTCVQGRTRGTWNGTQPTCVKRKLRHKFGFFRMKTSCATKFGQIKHLATARSLPCPSDKSIIPLERGKECDHFQSYDCEQQPGWSTVHFAMFTRG